MQVTFISETVFDQESFTEFVAALPDTDINRYELVGGKILMLPPSSWPYGEAEVDLCAVLRNHVKAGGLGMVGGPTQGYELPNGHTVAPDASVILKERLEQGPPRVKGRFLRVVPNLVAEIVSPTSKTRDRVDKPPIYAEAGVDEYWLIDLESQTVRVFHLSGEGSYDRGDTFGMGQKIRSRVLPKLECLVDELIPRD